MLNLLIPKRQRRKKKIFQRNSEAIDMDSYRVEKKAAMKIAADGQIAPSVESGGQKPEPKLNRLSNILKTWNEHWGTLFNDSDRALNTSQTVARRWPRIRPIKTRVEHSTRRISRMTRRSKSHATFLNDTQVYKQFVENESFRRAVTDMVFELTDV